MASDIWWEEDRFGKFLHCDYNESFVQAVKRVVPDKEREFDRKRRVWWISDGWIYEVDNLIMEHYKGYKGF